MGWKWLIGLLAVGCSTLVNTNSWYPTSLTPSKSHKWKVVSNITPYCGDAIGVDRYIQACASQDGDVCYIFSIYPENIARNIPDSSNRWLSVREHELAHCGLVDGIVWRHY